MNSISTLDGWLGIGIVYNLPLYIELIFISYDKKIPPPFKGTG